MVKVYRIFKWTAVMKQEVDILPLGTDLDNVCQNHQDAMITNQKKSYYSILKLCFPRVLKLYQDHMNNIKNNLLSILNNSDQLNHCSP